MNIRSGVRFNAIVVCDFSLTDWDEVQIMFKARVSEAAERIVKRLRISGLSSPVNIGTRTAFPRT